MPWIKAFHIIFMVTWFAGLFYLPRLFVYHSMAGNDSRGIARFVIMERKLFWGIMTPGAIVTVVLGLWMLVANWSGYMHAGWMHTKLFLILLLIGYHVWCGKLLIDFRNGENRHSHVWYRWFNEVPVVFLIGIVVLAVVRPF
ncbi:MAG: protoporphyrinogen oxidase HemJ [Gammaproteobacteria bacterium]|jgi:putative membrane protein|nr:protoporphyrinogen oxidase HemJ [Gammaproteobacteria bacterium]